MKVLILLSYFERPKLVRNALLSVLKSHEQYQNWNLVFGDDGSINEGKPIVEEILKDHLDKITFVNSNMTVEDKIKEGIQLGRYANEQILKSDADIVVTLSDDDELVPSYLKELVEFLNLNPNAMYCYSKIHLYNPIFQSSEHINNVIGPYNAVNGPINPVNVLDASQVAFRVECFRSHNIRFPNNSKLDQKPWLNNFDASLFEQLHSKFGNCVPTGLIGQFKGIHNYQLVWHKKAGPKGLAKYVENIRSIAGTVL